MMDRSDKLARFCEELGIAEGRNEPATRLLDAAMWTVPDVIKEIERDTYLPQGNKGGDAVAAKKLISQLKGKGHSETVASWAIYMLIGSQHLGAEFATLRFPEPAEAPSATTTVGVGGANITITEAPLLHTIRSSSEPGKTVVAQLPNSVKQGNTHHEVQYLVVWATDELWFWWRDQRGAFIEDESRDVGSLRWPKGQFSISGKNWHLLRCLWGQRKVSFSEVDEKVWGDDTTSTSTIRSQVHRLNDYLADKKSALCWECDKEHVVLVTAR